MESSSDAVRSDRLSPQPASPRKRPRIESPQQVVNLQSESTLKESSLQEHKQRIDSLEEEVQLLKDKNKANEESWMEIDRISADYQELTRKLEELNRDRQSDAKKLNELQRTLDDANTRITANMERMDTDRRHREEKQSSHELLVRVQKELDDANLQIEQLQDDRVEQTRKSAAELQQVTLRAEYQDRKIHHLEKQNDSLRTKGTAMQFALEKCKSDLVLSEQRLPEDLKAVLHLSPNLPLGMLERLSLSTEKVSVIDTDNGDNSEKKDVLFLYGQPPKPKPNMGVDGFLDDILIIALLAGGPRERSRELSELLWTLWGTLEFGHTTVQDLEVLAMPLISLVRRLFQESSVPPIALWVGCQIACHILTWMPSSVDLAIDFTNFKGVTPLVAEGCFQMTAQDHRRRKMEIPPRPTSGEPHPNVTIFECIYESCKTMAYIHRDSDGITAALALMDGKHFVWHHEAKYFYSGPKRFSYFIELSGGDAAPICIECTERL